MVWLLMQLASNWSERSEPHICGENGKLLYIYIIVSSGKYGSCTRHPTSVTVFVLSTHCCFVCVFSKLWVARFLAILIQ